MVIVLLALLIMMARLLVGLFDRLDIESRFRIADLSFEDPSSPVPIPAPSLFSEPTKALSIVIPAYNEEDRLPGTLEETMAYLQRRRDRQGAKFTYEVVVVDDGSTDRTVTKAQSFVRRYGFDAIRVLRLPANRGKGFAVKAGVLCCRGREVLFMDADGATGVSEVEKLEAKLQQIVRERTHAIAGAKPEGASEANHAYHDRNLHVGNGGTSSSRSSRFGSSWTSAAGYASAAKHQATNKKAMNGREHRDLPTAQLLDEPNVAFVLGSRAHLQESSMAKRTWVRNVLMHGFHFLVTMVVGNIIKDTQCGFKVMVHVFVPYISPQICLTTLFLFDSVSSVARADGWKLMYSSTLLFFIYSPWCAVNDTSRCKVSCSESEAAAMGL